MLVKLLIVKVDFSKIREVSVVKDIFLVQRKVEVVNNVTDD